MQRVLWAAVLMVTGLTFVTLTYHEQWPEDPHEQWLQLKAWARRMGAPWVLWRRELQARGAPHWHLLVAGVYGQGKCGRNWQAVTGDDTITQVRAQAVTSVRAVSRYVSKYCAKVVVGTPIVPVGPSGGPHLTSVTYSDERSSESVSIGRCWGIIGRCEVPWGEAQVVVIPAGRWVWRLRRCAARRWPGLQRRGVRGWRLYTDEWQAWMRLARYFAALEGVIVPCEGW
jgi:hypothetical protein